LPKRGYISSALPRPSHRRHRRGRRRHRPPELRYKEETAARSIIRRVWAE